MLKGSCQSQMQRPPAVSLYQVRVLHGSCSSGAVSSGGGAAPAGVISWGLQAMLFALLLFALLSGDTDPLTYTFRVLPLTDAAREQVRSRALNPNPKQFLLL